MVRLQLHRVSTSRSPSRPGLCRVLHSDLDGQCALDETLMSGSWALSPAQSANWTTARQACNVLCRSCARCRFMSLSLAHRNCSWRATCNLSALTPSLQGFWSSPLQRSFQRVGSLPPPLPLPSRAAAGYAMTTGAAAEHRIHALIPACARTILRRCKLRPGYERPVEHIASTRRAKLDVERVYLLHYTCATRRRDFQLGQLTLLGLPVSWVEGCDERDLSKADKECVSRGATRRQLMPSDSCQQISSLCSASLPSVPSQPNPSLAQPSHV